MGEAITGVPCVVIRAGETVHLVIRACDMDAGDGRGAQSPAAPLAVPRPSPDGARSARYGPGGPSPPAGRGGVAGVMGAGARTGGFAGVFPGGGGGTVLLLLPGDAAHDFIWSGGPGGRAQVLAGVAAALAARLQGDVLPERVLRGGKAGSARAWDFVPPSPDWWRGEWRVRAVPGREDARAQPGRGAGPTEDAGSPSVRRKGRPVAARLLLHGELVLA